MLEKFLMLSGLAKKGTNGGGASGLTGTPVWETLAEGVIPAGTEKDTIIDSGIYYSEFNKYYMVRIAIIASTTTGACWCLIPTNKTDLWAITSFTQHRGSIALVKLTDNYWLPFVRSNQNVGKANIESGLATIHNNFMATQLDRVMKLSGEYTARFKNDTTTTTECQWIIQGLKIEG